MKSASIPQLTVKKGGATHRPAGLLALFYALDLSVEQELALLRAQSRLRRQREAQREAWREGAVCLSHGVLDREAMYALVDRKAEAKKRAQRAEVDAFVDLFELLSPPQKAEVAARVEAGALRMQATQDLLHAA